MKTVMLQNAPKDTTGEPFCFGGMNPVFAINGTFDTNTITFEINLDPSVAADWLPVHDSAGVIVEVTAPINDLTLENLKPEFSIRAKNTGGTTTDVTVTAVY